MHNKYTQKGINSFDIVAKIAILGVLKKRLGYEYAFAKAYIKNQSLSSTTKEALYS